LKNEIKEDIMNDKECAKMSIKKIEEILLTFRVGEKLPDGIDVSKKIPVSEFFHDYVKHGGPAGDESWTNNILYEDDNYLYRHWTYHNRKSQCHNEGNILYILSDEERKYNIMWNINSTNLFFKKIMVKIIMASPYIITWDNGRSFSIFDGSEKGKVICPHMWGHDLKKIEEYFSEELSKVYKIS
jgi:hypothetical protein